MTTPATRSAKEARRETLLNAAFDLFREQGLARVTVDDIARSASVAKGTFYLYFKSKEELVDALRVEFAHQLRELVAGARPPREAPQWPAFLSQLVDALLGELADQQGMHDVLVELAHAHRPGDLSGALGDLHAAFASILRAGVDAGALDVPDPDVTASLVLELILAAGDRASADPPNRGRYTRACTTAVERWLTVRR
jgi:AcrR family transcriptional regulator